MPVIDFPSNPSNNELFIAQGKAMRYNSDKNKWRHVSTMSSSQISDFENKSVGVSSMSISGNTLVIQKDDSTHANVSLAAFAGNILTNYASASQLPITNLVSGTQVYVTDTDSLFITDGSGWYKIATVNLSPSLSLGVSSISMGSSDSVDVSYTVNEPEDTPYTITASSTSNASITVHQANNTLTFDTPVQNTTETITITATDGVNTIADTLTMTIQFAFDWSTGVQQAKILRPFNARSNDNFGVAVDLSEDGNYAIIGSLEHDRGHVHFWKRIGTTWNYLTMMSRTGGHPSDNRGFGRQVVMSADGTIALAGAYSDDNPSNLMDTGVLYIFTRSGANWSQHAVLAPTGGEIVNDMQYAIDFDISDDNNYIAVGAQQSKEIFIYKNDGSNNFTFQQKMMPSNMSGEGYAASLALNGDGSYLVATHSSQNRILVYTRTGTTWSEQTNFTVSGGNAIGRGNHGYGKGISLSTDGASLAVIDINNDSKTPVDGSNAKGGAVFVYTRSGSTWSQQAKIIPSDPVGYNSSPPNIRQLGDGGVSLSNDGTIIATGSRHYSTPNSVQTGRAYVYQKSSGWAAATDQLQMLKASDPQNDDDYGYSVAISNDGTYKAVGAPLEDTGGSNRGKVYIYIKSGTTWVEQAMIQSNDIANGDKFGQSISLNDAGDTLVVGAWFKGGSSNNGAPGAAYIFTRSGTNWTQQAKLLPDDHTGNNDVWYFGKGVHISKDGNYVIVGSPQAKGVSSEQQGAAYIYYRSGTSWSQQARLLASDGVAHDQMSGGGSSGDNCVRISGDANYAIVGAPYDDDNGTFAGTAFIFVRTGSTWSQQQKIQSAGITSQDRFGCSVAIDEDGDTVVVGSMKHDSLKGKSFVWVRSGTTWSQQAAIQHSDNSDTQNNGFGSSADIDDSGDIIIIGSNLLYSTSATAGVAYAFGRTDTSWTQLRKFVPDNPTLGDNFGQAIALSGDGKSVIFGAAEEDTTMNNSGAAYIFNDTGWGLQKSLTSTDIENNDEFGSASEISGDGSTVIVGAPREDTNTTDAGAVYTFVTT